MAYHAERKVKPRKPRLKSLAGRLNGQFSVVYDREHGFRWIQWQPDGIPVEPDAERPAFVKDVFFAWDCHRAGRYVIRAEGQDEAGAPDIAIFSGGTSGSWRRHSLDRDGVA